MEYKTIEIKCPGCGARVTTDQKFCEWCDRPILVSTFQSVAEMPMPELGKYARAYQNAAAENPDHIGINKSAAFCFLKLKMYDKALPAFEKAVQDNFDDSEIYFYAAVCLLHGKRAYMGQKAVIDQAIEYLNAANMIEPKGIYYYLLAYIKYDFYTMKQLRIKPDYQDDLNTAVNAGLSCYDVEQLYRLLDVPKPDCL